MKKIFWIDLEMTGLEPEVNTILEFAGIVTDLDMNPLAEIEHVVFQSDEELAKMDDWNRKTHGDSGLLAKIPGGLPMDQVEQRMIEFTRAHFGDERPVIAGNSIHQDRKFIDRHMPQLADLLHYRMLDVSAFKLIYYHLFQTNFSKKGTHRAMDDILESIDEMKFYLQFIKIPDTNPS